MKMQRTRIAVILILVATSVLLNTAMAQTKRKTSVQRGPIRSTGCVSCSMKVVPDLAQRLAKWKPLPMPFNSQRLTARERNLVDKLVQACQLLENIYWRQSDPEGLNLYQQLKDSKNTKDIELRRLIFINGGRFDLLENNQPLVGGDPVPPGRGFYPQGLTREQVEQYVKDHPDQKSDIYNPYTIVRRNSEELDAIHYSVAYRAFLEPAAKLLREAADLSRDPDFAKFLRLRADALLTDDYYQSDLAWIDLKDPKFDVILAPYETYLDDLLGVKTSYGPAVLIRNAAESRKLALYEKYVPDIQDALPLAPEHRPSKKGHLTPMEVMDAPYRSGDLRHGYQAVADNLPNDPRIHQEKGTKKIFFKNFMDARVNYIILPIAKRLMQPAQAAKASGAGYMAGTLMHEISHGLGPSFSRRDGQQVDIREAIGPLFGGLEEAKADVVGMFGLKWLVDHGVLPKSRLPEYYASYVAGIFRTVRFGIAEAHGRAEMMEFNYLSEQGAIKYDRASPRYLIDYARMPDAITAVAKELLEIEATGDRARAEAWFKKYEGMPGELRLALARVKDVPVDIDPRFSFPDKIE